MQYRNIPEWQDFFTATCAVQNALRALRNVDPGNLELMERIDKEYTRMDDMANRVSRALDARK